MRQIRSALIPLFAVTCLLFISNPALPKVKVPLTVKVVMTTAYDGNILSYSPRDLDRFETNTEIYPSEITTTDDWVNTFGLRVYRDFKLSHHLRFRPYYSGRISLYSVNQLRNYQYHYLMARFSYRYRVYLYLQYSYMPGYYLRVYKDRDLNEYHGCEFDLYRSAVSLRYRLPPYQIEGQVGREYTYYNSFFTEYDAEATIWGLSGSYQTPLDLDISLGYELKVSDNIGFKQSDLVAAIDPNEDTEYGDSSYEEDRFNLDLSYPLPLESTWGWTVSLGLERRLRYYQSDLPFDQDPFHVGRKDRRDRIEPAIAFSPSPVIDIQWSFTYDQRRTESPDPLVPSIKNFVSRTVELTVIYQVF